MNLGAELNASTCVGAVRLLDVDEVNLLRAEILKNIWEAKSSSSFKVGKQIYEYKFPVLKKYFECLL